MGRYHPAVDRVLREGEPGRSDRRVVVYARRSKQVLAAVGALVFVVLGGWLLTLGEVRSTVAGIAGIVVFGVFGVLIARRLADPSPVLVLDRDGLHDNASALSAGLIGWSEIAQVQTFHYRGQRMLGISVHDPGALLARQGPVARTLMRTNMRLVGWTVSIAQNPLPLTLDEVVAEMRTFLPPG